MGLIWANKRLFLWQIIAKKKNNLNNSDKDKFLVWSVHNLQSNWNSDFQENVFQEYYKNGGDSWFDTFMPKTLHFLGRPPFE